MVLFGKGEVLRQGRFGNWWGIARAGYAILWEGLGFWVNVGQN